jgi:hypothetical protein
MRKMNLAAAIVFTAIVAATACGCAPKTVNNKPGPVNTFAKSVPQLTPAQLKYVLWKKFHKNQPPPPPQ